MARCDHTFRAPLTAQTPSLSRPANIPASCREQPPSTLGKADVSGAPEIPCRASPPREQGAPKTSSSGHSAPFAPPPPPRSPLDAPARALAQQCPHHMGRAEASPSPAGIPQRLGSKLAGPCRQVDFSRGEAVDIAGGGESIQGIAGRPQTQPTQSRHETSTARPEQGGYGEVNLGPPDMAKADWLQTARG